MKYSLHMALLRLKTNLASYCFIALQLFLGFAILCTAFNVNYSLKYRLSELEDQTQNTQIRVNVLNSSVVNGSFGYEIYSQMDSDPTCPAGLLTTAFVKSTVNGAPDTIIVLCVPERYYHDLFSGAIEESRVYCSQEFFQAINDNKVVLFGSGTSLSLSDGKCTVDGHEYDLTVIENTAGIEEISRDENPDHNVDIDRILIFPESAGDFWEQEDFVSYQVYFYPAASEYYLNAYRLLYENFRDIAVSIYDPAAYLIKSCQDITDTIQLSAFISIVLLIISLIGTVGLFMITIYRRKKDIAVAVAVGSRRRFISMELFIEVFAVCAVGIVLGAVGAWGMTHLVRSHIVFFSASYAPQTACIAVLSCILIPAFVTKLSLSGFGEINITAYLHGEE